MADCTDDLQVVLKSFLDTWKSLEGFLRELVVSNTKRLDTHSERIRTLEDFRVRTEADRAREDIAMNAALARIEKTLDAQDKRYAEDKKVQESKIDALSKKIQSWGGGLSVLAFLISSAIALYEIFKSKGP